MAANNSEKQILGATNSNTYCIKNYKIYRCSSFTWPLFSETSIHPAGSIDHLSLSQFPSTFSSHTMGNPHILFPQQQLTERKPREIFHVGLQSEPWEKNK